MLNPINMNKAKKLFKNPYFIITVVYFLTNYFLLLLSGCWWDDWTFMTHDLAYIAIVAEGSGRPEWNVLIPLCWSLTNNGRILIFVLYYFDSIFVYNILKDSTLFDKKTSLIIALIFIIIPVNEARLLISDFPYTVGLFLFYFALMLFVKWNKKKKILMFRIGLLVLFFSSFILTSLLVYYYIIFIYLFVLGMKKNFQKRDLRTIFNTFKKIVINYLDFFVLPFVFLVVSRSLFPVASADFVARSSISFKGLLRCIKYLPLSLFNVIKEVLVNMISTCISIPILILVVIGTIVTLKKYNTALFENDNKFLYLLSGLVILVLGLFAYVEVRSDTIVCNGVKGRDAILVPLGISIIIYSLIVLINNKFRNVLFAIAIISGIVSCNLLFIEWQKDYYQQLSIEKLMNNEIVKNNDTFYFANLTESKVKGERYYSLSILANHVFKDETRLFIPKVTYLIFLKDTSTIDKAIKDLNYSSLMRDYKPDDYNLDAVLIYESYLDTKDVIALKYQELFNKEEFNKAIDTIGKMKIVEVDDDFTRLLLDYYDNDMLGNDNDVVELLNVKN